MSADDARAQAVECLTGLWGWLGDDAASMVVDALAAAGLLASPPVSWGVGLYPEDGGPVTIDETWLDRGTAAREVQSMVEEFELDLRLYEIREGDS
ncbi:hypothetical protein [Nocardia farcinica]|uniref:hypothetical protein n=1 Tax=Nocardia farcinica TaxID=37329 RepID=UPI0024557B06|nr:hypothetical protein [Nocardia farcinica]